jgi:type IV pilus assembly protein PilN
MAQINLLPWRQKIREEAQKEFLILLASVVGIALFIIGLIFIMVNGKISREQAVNVFLKDQTTVLDGKISQIQDIKAQRADLIAKRKVLQQLQVQRVAVVHLLEQAVYKIPDGVSLTKFEKQGSKLTIQGVAESNTRVSELMQNIEQSRWITNPQLTQIKAEENQQTDSKIRSFEITMTEHLPDIEQLHAITTATTPAKTAPATPVTTPATTAPAVTGGANGR